MATLDRNQLIWKRVTAEYIKKTTDELIENAKAVYDAVGALKPEQMTYDNVVKALSDHDREYSVRRNNIDFVQYVYANKALRDASVDACKDLSGFFVETSMRQDVFDVISAFQEKAGHQLKEEANRYVERLVKLGKRNGLHLPKETQEEIKEIQKRISDLSTDFSKNLNEENTVLEFRGDELVGLPADFIRTLDKTEKGLCKLSLKYPHCFAYINIAQNPETRRKLVTAFNSRCLKKNTEIIEELVKLRHEKAQLLGFPTHAAFVLDMRMAKTPVNVSTFLTNITQKLQPLKDEEMQLFLQYKKEECEKYGYDFDEKINMWDLHYYMTMAEEKKYRVDQNNLKEYFPMEVVTDGLMNIYQKLLNLQFSEVPNADTWNEDVKLYSVKDRDSGDLLGYFYLDLYPRDAKYGHAACFGLQPGCLLSDGKRQITVVALVANFTKPTADHPSLLQHIEVVTYFHEFGHVMHYICAQAEFALFSCESVERDFVEAPSQMLENWCWEKESLKIMSKHYKDETPIPDEILENLMKSRVANAGMANLKEILLGRFDQTIHTQAQADTATVLFKLSEEIMGFPSISGTNKAASFGHLAEGYDAQYYGYLWSEVFSMDMFYSRFLKEGIMNTKVGMDYRKYILQPGGSQDSDVMLRNFLGRDPKQDAFLISKGFKV